MALPGKRSLRKAIEEHGGVISEIAAHFNKSRQTIYRWLDHYSLRGEVQNQRESMRQVSRDVIYQRLMSNDDDKAYDAAKFVMLHLNDDGELLTISPEAMMLLRRMGLSTSEVVAEFEAIIAAMAKESA